MSDIEAAAAPIVGPMMAGRGTTLDESAQAIVARWIFLRALVLNLTQSPRNYPIPQEHYDAFYATREPPPYSTVLVSVYAGGQHATIFVTEASRITYTVLDENGDRRSGSTEAYFATLAAGHFIGQAFVAPMPTGDELDHVPVGVFAAAVRRISPFDAEFIWPPGFFLDEEALGKLVSPDIPLNPAPEPS